MWESRVYFSEDKKIDGNVAVEKDINRKKLLTWSSPKRSKRICSPCFCDSLSYPPNWCHLSATLSSSFASMTLSNTLPALITCSEAAQVNTSYLLIVGERSGGMVH